LVEPRGVGAESAKRAGDASPQTSFVANLIAKCVLLGVGVNVTHNVLEINARGFFRSFSVDKNTADINVEVPDMVLQHGVVIIRGNARALDGVTALVNLTNTVFKTANCGGFSVRVSLNPHLHAVYKGQVGYGNVGRDEGKEHPRFLGEVKNGSFTLAGGLINANESKLHLEATCVTVVVPCNVIELEEPETLGVIINSSFPVVGVQEAVCLNKPPKSFSVIAEHEELVSEVSDVPGRNDFGLSALVILEFLHVVIVAVDTALVKSTAHVGLDLSFVTGVANDIIGQVAGHVLVIECLGVSVGTVHNWGVGDRVVSEKRLHNPSNHFSVIVGSDGVATYSINADPGEFINASVLINDEVMETSDGLQNSRIKVHGSGEIQARLSVSGILVNTVTDNLVSNGSPGVEDVVVIECVLIELGTGVVETTVTTVVNAAVHSVSVHDNLSEGVRPVKFELVVVG
jgi:hypothetical protein